MLSYEVTDTAAEIEIVESGAPDSLQLEIAAQAPPPEVSQNEAEADLRENFAPLLTSEAEQTKPEKETCQSPPAGTYQQPSEAAPEETAAQPSLDGSDKEPPKDGPPPTGGSDSEDPEEPRDSGDVDDDKTETRLEASDMTLLREAQEGSEAEVIVQEFASGPDTLRVCLSLDIYEHEGLGAFSAEGIPYAGRTSREYADKVATLAAERITTLEAEQSDRTVKEEDADRKHHLYELGAGSGMLSRRIADNLKEQHPDIYEKTVLHVTDFSDSTVEAWRQAGLSTGHEGHMVLERMNGMHPEFPENAKPTMVYHTYLGDSLPTHHIVTRGGQVFEQQIQTTIPADAHIIDPTGEEPQVLNAAQIKDIIDNDPERRARLAPRISGIMHEDFREVPLEETNLSDADKERLERRASRIDGDAGFNYSLGLEESLEASVEAVRETGGIVLVSDFGNHNPWPAGSDVRTQYGAVVSNPVNFFTLDDAGKELGTSTAIVQPHQEGGPREVLFDTHEQSEVKNATMQTFGRNFVRDDTPAQINEFLETAEMYIKAAPFADPEKFDQVREGFMNNVRQRYSDLPAAARENLTTNHKLAHLLLTNGHPEESLTYAARAIQAAPHVNAKGYYLVAAAHMSMGDTGETAIAESALKTAEAIAPELALTYNVQMQLYKRTGDTEDFMRASNNYLRHTRDGDELRAMRFTADTLREQGHTERANTIMRSARRLAQTIGQKRLHPDEWEAVETYEE